MSKLDEFLERLEGVRRSGGGHTARCPAHEDRDPSLSVREGSRWILFYCHAGCTAQSILDAMKLGWADVSLAEDSEWVPPEDRPKRPFDRRAVELESKMMASRLLGDSEVLSRSRDARGWAKGALAHLGVGWDGERYTLPVHDQHGNLHDVLRYDPFTKKRKILAGEGRTRQPWPRPEDVELGGYRHLWIVEGEGTAISMWSCGMRAVALPGAIARQSGELHRPGKFEGVGWHQAWAKRFSRFDSIVCVPDCDDVGRLLMMTVAYDIEKLPGDRVVTVADLGLTGGYDAGDLLRKAVDLESRSQGKQLLHMLADTARRQPQNVGSAQQIVASWAEWMDGGKEKLERETAAAEAARPPEPEELQPLWNWE